MAALAANLISFALSNQRTYCGPTRVVHVAKLWGYREMHGATGGYRELWRAVELRRAAETIDSYRQLQTAAGSYRELQGTAESNRELQRAAGSYRQLQGATRSCRELRRAAESYRELQQNQGHKIKGTKQVANVLLLFNVRRIAHGQRQVTRA